MAVLILPSRSHTTCRFFLFAGQSLSHLPVAAPVRSYAQEHSIVMACLPANPLAPVTSIRFEVMANKFLRYALNLTASALSLREEVGYSCEVSQPQKRRMSVENNSRTSGKFLSSAAIRSLSSSKPYAFRKTCLKPRYGSNALCVDSESTGGRSPTRMCAFVSNCLCQFSLLESPPSTSSQIIFSALSTPL